MTILHTARLQLMALPAAQLHLAVDHGFPYLYSTLDLAADALNIYPEFLSGFEEAVRNFCLPQTEARPQAYEWYTNWLIVLPEAARVIGGIGLAGLPNAEGTTEVGYFIDSRYEGRGYATEALGRLASWAGKQPALRGLIAHTPSDHPASQRILQKNGFREIGRDEDIIQWVLEMDGY